MHGERIDGIGKLFFRAFKKFYIEEVGHQTFSLKSGNWRIADHKIQQDVMNKFRDRFTELYGDGLQVGSTQIDPEGLTYCLTRFVYPSMKIMGGKNRGLYFQRPLIAMKSAQKAFSF